MVSRNADLFSERTRREYSWETFFWAAAMLVLTGYSQGTRSRIYVAALVGAMRLRLEICPGWLGLRFHGA